MQIKLRLVIANFTYQIDGSKKVQVESLRKEVTYLKEIIQLLKSK